MASIVRTVMGDVPPETLGRTLTHEHLSGNFKYFYRKRPQITDKAYMAYELQTIRHVRQYPYSFRSNLLLNDSYANEAVLRDVQDYKTNGGGTIVENTTEGLGRNLKFYHKVMTTTGVNIVGGTGYYIADMQRTNYLYKTIEELYDHMLAELTTACVGNPSVRAGFIGEIGSVWPIRDFERKVIRAAGEVQTQVGCGVSFHPHHVAEAPFEIIRLYLEAGGKIDKAVMSHLDRTLLDPAKLLEFSELGAYCQFDSFGTEVSYSQLNSDMDMPTDDQRLNMIWSLLEDQKEDKILMSHDIHTKHRLTKHGGHGYSHILVNVLPRMKLKGITQYAIDQITIENPAEWLSIPN